MSRSSHRRCSINKLDEMDIIMFHIYFGIVIFVFYPELLNGGFPYKNVLKNFGLFFKRR